ncbi:MAG: hypothetical protein Alpg2KO_28720 [Alphaproteobacteria bacterium]
MDPHQEADLREYRRVVIPRARSRDLGFTGKLMASNVETGKLRDLTKIYPDDLSEHSEDRKTIAALWQLMSGKYVCFARWMDGRHFDYAVETFQGDQMWSVEEFFITLGPAGKLLLKKWGRSIVEELE